MSLIIGVDASRNKSGGAIAHLKGIIENFSPNGSHGIQTIHLWAYQGLLDQIPNFPWLVKHCPKALEKSLPYQILWQFTRLHKEAERLGCDLMFNTDAGSVCHFQPSVTLSQDMLSFEPGEMKRFGLSKAMVRLWLLKYVQAHSLRNSTAAIFLTTYAAKTIESAIGPVKKKTVIPHGVDEYFRVSREPLIQAYNPKRPFRCVYVSNTSLYKHQWHVAQAVSELKANYSNLELLFIGGGTGPAQLKLKKAMQRYDPNSSYIKQLDFIKHKEIPKQLMQADVFIFASSCENMPITLIEAMATGLPISCSDRGPMPEVLQQAGIYFDPEDPQSIQKAIQILIESDDKRTSFSQAAKHLSQKYTWQRCANETWNFIGQCAKDASKKP